MHSFFTTMPWKFSAGTSSECRVLGSVDTIRRMIWRNRRVNWESIQRTARRTCLTMDADQNYFLSVGMCEESFTTNSSSFHLSNCASKTPYDLSASRHLVRMPAGSPLSNSRRVCSYPKSNSFSNVDKLKPLKSLVGGCIRKSAFLKPWLL